MYSEMNYETPEDNVDEKKGDRGGRGRVGGQRRLIRSSSKRWTKRSSTNKIGKETKKNSKNGKKSDVAEESEGIYVVLVGEQVVLEVVSSRKVWRK